MYRVSIIYDVMVLYQLTQHMSYTFLHASDKFVQLRVDIDILKLLRFLVPMLLRYFIHTGLFCT